MIRPVPPVEKKSRSTLTTSSGPATEEVQVHFDPRLLAIGMTTAPRANPTLETTVTSLRFGQFSQTVHLFTEPATLPQDWRRDGVVIHQNQRRMGCYPNWLQMAKWLIEQTDAPYLLLLEDDGLFCRGAAPGLYYGLTHLENIGCLSLYTPNHNYQLHTGVAEGWFALDASDRWGTVAHCFPRSVLTQFLKQADWSRPEGTDRYLDHFMNVHGLRWYTHAPSLVDHIGIDSTLGHISNDENAGVAFRSDFVGYRHTLPSVPTNPTNDETASTPAVSIVLPSYNGARFLRQSIDSCLQQSFPDWELIIVDDGSTDETDQVIRSYRESRILSIRHSINRRLPAALNTGFRMCRGEFLTWTSCDNRYSPDALEVLVDFLRRNRDTDLVYADCNLIDERGRKVGHYQTGPTERLIDHNVIGACFLYRREVYRVIGNYEVASFLAEDYDYWLRTSQQFRLTHLPRTLYDYRLHPDSLTSKFSNEIPLVTQGVKARYEVPSSV